MRIDWRREDESLVAHSYHRHQILSPIPSLSSESPPSSNKHLSLHVDGLASPGVGGEREREREGGGRGEKEGGEGGRCVLSK